MAALRDWVLNRRFLLSACVALVVAIYGYQLMLDAARASAPPFPAPQPPPPPFQCVLRLFFVTFAATYVLDYIFMRTGFPAPKGSTATTSSMAGGGSAYADVQKMMENMDRSPPRF
jgi:hypothetical protein